MIIKSCHKAMARKSGQTTKTSISEVAGLLERLRERSLAEGDMLLLERVVAIFLSLIAKIEQQKVTVKQIRSFLFGKPKKNEAQKENSDVEQTQEGSKAPEEAASSEPKPKREGHGRKPASSCRGAKVVFCQQEDLKENAPCLDKLCKGHLQHFYRKTAPFLRYEGQPLIGATRYDQEMLRCSACTTLYTAKLPDGVPPQKYDATADAAITLAKYGGGMPFNRLSQLQANFGIPFSASVMWERVLCVANALLPVFFSLRLLAAQASVLHYDDTGIKIINCQPHKSDKRKGIRTTAIVANLDDYKITLYVSGRNHAGDNISDLLKNRPVGLGVLIRVCDALKLNLAVAAETIISLCLQHGRRKFVDLKDQHSEDCQPVLDVIGQVYANDAMTKGLQAEERLLYHQLYSGPLMEALKEWIEERFDKRIVEPVSAVGSAYNYLLSHWQGLTQWLRTAKAPLDNNAAERALKIVVMHRKNANYFRSDVGAFVADICMSIIGSCRINGIDPFPYLVALIRNEGAVREDPADWLPWVYAKRMADETAIVEKIA